MSGGSKDAYILGGVQGVKVTQGFGFIPGGGLYKTLHAPVTPKREQRRTRMSDKQIPPVVYGISTAAAVASRWSIYPRRHPSIHPPIRS